MSERISITQAAQMMGVSEQFVRIGMQRGILPIGSCVKMSSKYTYFIARERLNEYLGKKKEPTAATIGSSTALYDNT